jgi:DnaJ-class molecular chaperone
MKLSILKAIFENSMKIVPLIIVIILLNSCNSKRENLKNRVIMNYISSLKEAVDSLNQNVDSLNYRLLQLEENAANQELVTESQADVPADSRKIICPNCNGKGDTQETCDNCRGSGYKYNLNCKSCSQYYTSSQGKGYVNRTCNVCRGNGRINEYE